MTKTDQKFQLQLKKLEKTLINLQEALAFPPDVPHQESAVKRFELTFELAWKLMQSLAEGADENWHGPRNAIRLAAQLGYISQPERWFFFIEKRNESTHLYKEQILHEIVKSLPEFVELAAELIEKVKAELEQKPHF